MQKGTNAITALIWDNDGVLVDTEELYYSSAREVLAEIGIILDFDLFSQISLKQGRSVFDLARKQGIPESEISALRMKRNLRYTELLQQGVRVYPGVRKMLQILHGTVKMGIVTSSLKDHFDIIHRSTGLLGYFDFILTKEDYTHTKPHPEPFLTAIEKNDLNKDECIIIEDSERGLTAAQKAEIKCVIILNEINNHGNFTGAYRILKNVSELVDLVLI